jgi:hypothetical protein
MRFIIESLTLAVMTVTFIAYSITLYPIERFTKKRF